MEAICELKHNPEVEENIGSGVRRYMKTNCVTANATLGRVKPNQSLHLG
jgi:hypothetical protein